MIVEAGAEFGTFFLPRAYALALNYSCFSWWTLQCTNRLIKPPHLVESLEVDFEYNSKEVVMLAGGGDLRV